MDTYLLLAYITGGLLVAYSLFLYIFPSRKVNLYLKAGSNLISCINLTFIYLYTDNPLVIVGIVTNAICIVREILFSFRDNCKILNHLAWPIGFSIILMLSLVFTYTSPLSLLPPIGSVVTTMCFYAKSPKILKTGAIVATAIYIVYYAILIPSSDTLTIFALLCTVAGFISSTVGLIVLLYKEKHTPVEETN